MELAISQQRTRIETASATLLIAKARRAATAHLVQPALPVTTLS
jgi:hypothetical protein